MPRHPAAPVHPHVTGKSNKIKKPNTTEHPRHQNPLLHPRRLSVSISMPGLSSFLRACLRSARAGNDCRLLQHPWGLPRAPPAQPRAPYPHGAPHGALLRVVGFHLQHVGRVLLPVQGPQAAHHQPAAGVDPKVVVLVPYGGARKRQRWGPPAAPNVLRAAPRWLREHPAQPHVELALPLTILYHTLPFTPSSASVAFTFARKAKQGVKLAGSGWAQGEPGDLSCCTMVPSGVPEQHCSPLPRDTASQKASKPRSLLLANHPGEDAQAVGTPSPTHRKAIEPAQTVQRGKFRRGRPSFAAFCAIPCPAAPRKLLPSPAFLAGRGFLLRHAVSDARLRRCSISLSTQLTPAGSLRVSISN